MKTLIASLALAASLTFANPVTTFGNNGPGNQPTGTASYKTGIYPSANNRLNIALDKQTTGAVSICLKDQKGNVLFSQRVGKHESTYRTRLNLNDLADGTYQVEITNGFSVTQQTVTLATQPPVAAGRIVLTEAAPAQP